MKWLASWGFYYLGAAADQLMQRFDWGWLYPAYNRAMLLSCNIQGDGPGPWVVLSDFKKELNL